MASAPSALGEKRHRQRARALDLAVPLLVAIAAGAVALHSGPRIYDDAYITLRYARNLTEGTGLVYNPGERVLGTSAPLFAVLLAALARLSRCHDFVRLSFETGAVALPVLAFLVWRLIRHYLAPLAAAAVALAALAQRETLRAFASGMETPIYLLTIVGALALLRARHDRAALGLASVVPFLHPEGALLFGALVLAMWMRDRRPPLRAAAVGVLPGLAAAIAQIAYFGSSFPESLLAKSRIYFLPAGRALADLAQSSLAVLLPLPLYQTLPSFPAVLGLAVELASIVVLSAALGLLLWKTQRVWREPTAFAAATFGGAYLVFFAAANPLVFPWYYPPFQLTAVLVLGFALAGLPQAWRHARLLAAVLLVLLTANSGVAMLTFRPYDTGGREAPYQLAMERLDPPATSLVAAAEIGAIGYSTRAHILDTAGLVTPGSLRFYDDAWRAGLAHDGSAQGGDVPPRLLRAARPDFIVVLTCFLERARRIDAGCLDGYRLIASYPAYAFGSTAVEVYRRR